MHAKVKTLTCSTSDLIMAVLRQSVEQQQSGKVWHKSSRCSTEEIEAVTIIMPRLSWGHLTVEVKAVHNPAVWQAADRLGIVGRLQTGGGAQRQRSREQEEGAEGH